MGSFKQMCFKYAPVIVLVLNEKSYIIKVDDNNNNNNNKKKNKKKNNKRPKRFPKRTVLVCLLVKFLVS